MRQKIIAAGLAILVIAGAHAGAAPAKPRPGRRPASRQTAPEVAAQFALSGTSGFEIGVGLVDGRDLTLGAFKFGAVIQSVTYKLRVRPRPGSDGIVADLGKLGRIDVRFLPEKIEREKPPEGCRGPSTTIEQGHFVGVISFHGENGFTEVHAHRVPGAITRRPSFRCKAEQQPNLKKIKRELEALENEGEPEGAEEEEEEEVEGLSVSLSAEARAGHVALGAEKAAFRPEHGKGFAIVNIAVIGKRRRGRIDENSSALYVLGKGSTFLVPDRKDPKSEGILQPPAPFTGSGTFRRHPKGAPTWTGDLKVDLPGFGQVRLAGPGTRASMCEGSACFRRRIHFARDLLGAPESTFASQVGHPTVP